MSRTPREIASDFLLLLYLISAMNKKGVSEGCTKLQKMVFLSEYEMLNKKIKGMNYNFYKWNHGPFSKELVDAIDYLVSTGVISDSGIRLEKHGEEILALCEDTIQKNQSIKEIIDHTIDEFADLSLDGILSFVYDIGIKYPLYEKKIKDIPKGWDIPLEVNNLIVTGKFEIGDEIVETLDIYLDKDFYKSVRESMEDVRAGRVVAYGEEFEGV